MCGKTKPDCLICVIPFDLSGTRSAAGDSIPTDAEQATGLEKKEYDAMAAGIEVCYPVCLFFLKKKS